ncbi:hypothetical protein [Paraliomyxa miuraensis]|uniref:hypothetical protein n=1 Tax=Paraliomyxa miuraensis TaxID=376150 RepID=UPI0022580F80|nr:hypothetical protein [Paraliomyxa miuraensis]MCX4244815.1 hypothetical protein [Paraliomyxa miuraensis]
MPKDNVARKHFDAAVELYKAGDYEASIVEAKAGLVLEEHESLLFILAQAERQSGKCIDAVDTFSRFIALTENDDMRQNALTAKAMCAEELAERARLAELVAREAAEQEPEPEPEPEPPPPPPPKPFYFDPLGDALVGVGGAAVIAGGALLIVSATIHPEDEPLYGDFEKARARQQTMLLAGGITLGAGVLVAAGGAVRWVLVAKKNKKAQTTPAAARVQMGPWLDPRRAGVVLRARF